VPARARRNLWALALPTALCCSHTYELGSLSDASVQARVTELAGGRELRTPLSTGETAVVTLGPRQSVVRPLPLKDARADLPTQPFLLENKEITQLETKSRVAGAAEGVLLGTLSGGALGVLFGLAQWRPPTKGQDNGCLAFCTYSDPVTPALEFGALFALAGAIVGGTLGAELGDRTTFVLR
jgi:hypothetical protein